MFQFSSRTNVSSAQSKLDVNRAPRQERLLELRTKLIQLESRQKESFQCFENGTYTNERLLTELHEIKDLQQSSLSEQEEIERELILQPNITIPKEKIYAALQQLQHVLNMASFDRQKELLGMLVEKITLPPNRNVREAVISWKFCTQEY